MKIALAQNNYRVGDIEQNTTQIINTLKKAEKEGAAIVIFSELCICGYPPYDLLSYDYFIKACEKGVREIAQHTTNVAAIVGVPERNPDKKGKPLFNAAYFIHQGEVKHKVYKALLPDYDVFDEYRFFEPATHFSTIEYKGKKIALTICEDLWNIGKEGLYKQNPMEVLALQKPDFIINIAASPFDYEQQNTRHTILKANVKKYKIPLVYVNQVGAHTDLIFDGTSLLMDKQGHVIHQCASFSEDFYSFDVFENSAKCSLHLNSKIAQIHDALILGVKDYFNKSGLKKAVLGLSGGIDSALTYIIAVKALGVENVMGILMPSEFSSAHSIEDAVKSATNVGGKYEIIPIKNAFNTVYESLQGIFTDLPFDVTEENLQARLRALILMAYSNKFGHVLLNTSNKSEAAVGYGTLYGDMCGGLAVLADVYKTEVYELSHYINKEKELIPENSINKVPSAELRPDQKDSDSLPEYDVLDQILYLHIEKAMAADEIIAKGFNKEIVKKIIRLVYLNEYKRFQSAPVLRVSSKAFGHGRKLPIVASYKNITT